MSISDKLKEIRLYADRNDDALADDLTDLTSEVYTLCKAVEILSEAVYSMRYHNGPKIVEYSDRTLDRIKDILKVSNV